MLLFSSRNDFKILSELLLILDFINHIHYCIRLDYFFYYEFSHSYTFSIFLVFGSSHDKDAVKHFGIGIHKTHLKYGFGHKYHLKKFVYSKHKSSRRGLSCQQ